MQTAANDNFKPKKQNEAKRYLLQGMDPVPS